VRLTLEHPRARTTSKLAGLGAQVPGEDDTLIDTALYLAASRENARAAGLLRRERLGLAAMAGVTAACVALGRKTRAR
jgi:hypothetical protein